MSRGADTAGLLRYLFGPGRANEHTDPHLVATWDDALTATPVTGTRQQQRHLTQLLNQPLTALARTPVKSVWHCSIRTAPGDRRLSDAEWAEAAREVLHTVGLARRDDADGCRWVAVRHGPDHIHLAVTLARQDGRLARTSHDFARVGQACQALEARYGLTATAPRDRSAPRRPSRAETEKARRVGTAHTPREALRREVRVAAAGATDLASFMELLREQGVLVRERHSTTTLGDVTGYAVAWPGDHTATGQPVWFGGGKLSPDLSLPRLQERWTSSGGAEAAFIRDAAQRHGRPLPKGHLKEAANGWKRAAALSVHAAHVLRDLDSAPGEVADVQTAATALLIATARALEGLQVGPLTRAAEAYERAGIVMQQRPASASGSLARGLHVTARHLRSASPANEGDLQRLLLALADLTRAAALRHHRHGRGAQADAAQQASIHLHDATSARNRPRQPPASAMKSFEAHLGAVHGRSPSPSRRR